MEKRKKNKIKSAIALVLVVCLAGFLAVMPRLAGSGQDSDGASILSAQVSSRSIDRILQAAGKLENADAEDVTVPNGVRVTELLVRGGDSVRAGDPLAKVDRVSVMAAITEIQDALDELDEELADAEKLDSEEITVRQDGTVKYVYAQPGDDAAAVMRQYGALAVLSLDDKMVVELPDGSSLAVGQRVAVELPDGTEQVGFVESRIGAAARVSMEDTGLDVGTPVTVRTEAGKEIGTGELRISSPWNIVAFSGTVDRVRCEAGDSVSSGKTLFDMKDMRLSSHYEGLLIQRQAYEQEMLKLFLLYQSGTVTAPRDGIVTGTNEAVVSPLSYADGSIHLDLLVNAPNGDDETQYLNFALAVLDVREEGFSVMMNGTPMEVTDYADLSGLVLDTEAVSTPMTLPRTVPVYAMYGGVWRQMSADAVQPGDLLLGAFNAAMEPVWAVLVEPQEESQDPTEPSEPGDPTVPTIPGIPDIPGIPGDPTDPTVPTEPGDPAAPTVPGDPTIPDIPFNPGTVVIPEIPTDYPSFGGFTMDGTTQMPQGSSRYEIREETVLTVASGAEMLLNVTFDERDIGCVMPGMTAEVVLEALPEGMYTARVESVSHTGTNSGGSSKFAAQLSLALEGDMLPGMNACAVFTLETLTDVLTLPVAALAESSGESVVYTAYDAEKNLLSGAVSVTVGASDGEYVQVSGLGAGTVVWYAYYDTLKISNTVDVNRFGY